MTSTNIENILNKDNRRFWMGLSMVWIYAYHVLIFMPDKDFNHLERIILSPIGNGFLGVDIFLFLSAFGLCHSVSKGELSTYYKKRVLRIVPTYVLFFLTLMCLLYATDTTNSIDMRDFLFQITGLAVINSLSPKIEWFTPALMAMYITFPVVFFVSKKYCATLWRQFVLVALAVLSSNLMFQYLDYQLIARIPVILAGVYTYQWLMQQKSPRNVVIAYALIGSTMAFAPNQFIRLGASIPLILYGFGGGNLKSNILTDSLKYIGNYTYEIYLAQVIATLYILHEGYLSENGVLAMVECSIITLFLTTVFYCGTKFLNQLASRIVYAKKN